MFLGRKEEEEELGGWKRGDPTPSLLLAPGARSHWRPRQDEGAALRPQIDLINRGN